MTALIIIIILIFAWPYIWRWLQPYFYRWMQHRAEDYVRKSMGMPPRDRGGSKARTRTSGSSGFKSSSQSYRGSRHSYDEGSIIPKEYAEDVEFTEIRSYSSDSSSIASDGDTVRYREESQVSDAEIIEIKKD